MSDIKREIEGEFCTDCLHYETDMGSIKYDIVNECNSYEKSGDELVLNSSKSTSKIEEHQSVWIENMDNAGNLYYECSNCGEAFCIIEGTPADNLYNYCPNCGVKMSRLIEQLSTEEK